MKTALQYFWHFLVVLLVLAVSNIGVGLSVGSEFYDG